MGNGMKEIVTSFPENSRKISWGTGYFKSESCFGGEKNWRRRTQLCGPADHLAPMFPGVCENAMGVNSTAVRAIGSAEWV